MKKTFILLAVATFVYLSCTNIAHAWDVVYDAGAGVLPAAATPSWDMITGDNPPAPVLSGGALHISRSPDQDNLYFQQRESAPMSWDTATVEAQVRVAGSSGAYGTMLYLATQHSGQLVELLPNRLVLHTGLTGGMASILYLSDFTAFRTIRLAVNEVTGVSKLWVDGNLAVSTVPGIYGGGSRIQFGSIGTSSTSDSYWQYVAYSKEFSPVPEPSCMLILLGGIGGLGGFALRRKQQ